MRSVHAKLLKNKKKAKVKAQGASDRLYGEAKARRAQRQVLIESAPVPQFKPALRSKSRKEQMSVEEVCSKLYDDGKKYQQKKAKLTDYQLADCSFKPKLMDSTRTGPKMKNYKKPWERDASSNAKGFENSDELEDVNHAGVIIPKKIIKKPGVSVKNSAAQSRSSSKPKPIRGGGGNISRNVPSGNAGNNTAHVSHKALLASPANDFSMDQFEELKPLASTKSTIRLHDDNGSDEGEAIIQQLLRNSHNGDVKPTVQTIADNRIAKINGAKNKNSKNSPKISNSSSPKISADAILRESELYKASGIAIEDIDSSSNGSKNSKTISTQTPRTKALNNNPFATNAKYSAGLKKPKAEKAKVEFVRAENAVISPAQKKVHHTNSSTAKNYHTSSLSENPTAKSSDKTATSKLSPRYVAVPVPSSSIRGRVGMSAVKKGDEDTTNSKTSSDMSEKTGVSRTASVSKKKGHVVTVKADDVVKNNVAKSSDEMNNNNNNNNNDKTSKASTTKTLTPADSKNVNIVSTREVRPGQIVPNDKPTVPGARKKVVVYAHSPILTGMMASPLMASPLLSASPIGLRSPYLENLGASATNPTLLNVKSNLASPNLDVQKQRSPVLLLRSPLAYDASIRVPGAASVGAGAVLKQASK